MWPFQSSVANSTQAPKREDTGMEFATLAASQYTWLVGGGSVRVANNGFSFDLL